MRTRPESDRLLRRPGLSSSAEDGAWDELRERVEIVLRPIGAPTSLGLFAGIFELSGHHSSEDVAGVTGLAPCALAIYGAWAGELEDALGQTVLPLGRHGKGKVAIHGSLLEQVMDAPKKAGVRAQL